MARARNIKPSFFTNELLGTFDPIIGMTFIGMWCLADRDGRLEDRPLRIKAELFPYRESLDVNGYLTELERAGFIERYQVDGVGYIQIINFTKHQTPHNTEKAKGYPAKPAPTLDNGDVTVKQPLSNGEITEAKRPDSLIPDSLNHESGNMKEDSKKTQGKPARFDPLAIPLPDCIKPSAWEAWIKYRRNRKLTCAEDTMRSQLQNLEAWWNEGHEPNSIMQASITNGWQGLFAPKLPFQSKPVEDTSETNRRLAELVSRKFNLVGGGS